ncbi:hypothetical protein GCM10012285_05810 [Streptomyces kronopolitis]|uniref:Ricin B lectin domain-containing protein n=1 Tax=Streptomyces kronopolitis TaxID=1612435 RepID=A0ABQ2J0V6_9ACTN|nr:hypothetical protein [Streptomyces kronopolitis]GGN34035.1 hypothetical protein GCM10012285_05810 [Streptomyces kronopolitis]
MARFRRISRAAKIAAVAGMTAACLTVLPGTSAVAAARSSSGAVLIANGLWSDRILCASPNDDSVWLQSITFGNPYCQWIQIGDNGHFTLFNLAKNKVMAYEGGNEGPLVMEGLSFPTRVQQQFSFGGRESWGASALQSSLDIGQNVDAKNSYNDDPRTTEPVHTRGWRHGHQMELTWNTVSVS